MDTQAKRKSDGYNNSNTGALYANDAPLTDAILTGVWENGAGKKFGLGISADNAGVRQIAVLSKAGELVSKGTVSAVPAGRNRSKLPAYRGTLGKLKIVLWEMAGYYQVRIDSGRPERQVSDEARSFFGATLTSKPHVEVDEAGPF